MKSTDGKNGATHSRHSSGGRSRNKIATGLAMVLALVGIYWWLWHSGVLGLLGNEGALRGQIERLGFWGPFAVIVLMIGAIVLSPIPSGPIALVAGAVYGPVLGTVYVVIGAEGGAIIAFWIARSLGYEVVRRWSRVEPLLDRLRKDRSQTWLMAIVFASRLIPFISFDAVSYAAGLTPLAFWRFAVATLAGVIPISFLLAYVGKELIGADPMRVLLMAVLVGAITLIPIVLTLLRGRHRDR